MPPTIIGSSPALRRTLELARKAAPYELSVLLHGETGTGKEGLARWIHDRSDRYGPFVAVNCATLTESLLDAELFGHERGAFTGANTARHGLFEAAHQGTLFLDEVGDLSPSAQARLLRVLQERCVRRVGATRETPVNVRIVAATHMDLGQAVQDGRFREDLRYRLAELVLELPPLRDRGRDVLALAEHFVRTEPALKGRELTRGARRSLLGRRWPGNVRELRATLLRAAIVEDGPITLDAESPDPTRQILALLDRPRTSTELRLATDLPRTSLHRVLTGLEKGGQIRRSGAGRGTTWRAA